MGPETEQFLPDPNPRRQDKIIAAVLRNNPRLVLEDQVKLGSEERALYLRRVGRGEIQEHI